MINLQGFQIDHEIYRSANSVIFSGSRMSDSAPVILKLLNKEFPTNHEISYFMREFQITKKIKGDSIIKAFSLEKYNNSLVIVLEDCRANSIRNIIKSQKLQLIDKLALVIKICEGLSQIHENKIIHKDINPSNIIWNKESDQLRIIDFGISVEISSETSPFVNINVLEGTLDYISPEQTGRMNRPIDYRTDLYSFGVSMYEIFTKELPFSGNDDAEIVYHHLASIPLSPSDRDPNVPDMIYRIILKLLSKTAEARYQSASGLKWDLERCLNELKSEGKISEFPLGEKDFTEKFQIPHTLYGREKEVENLVHAFESAAEGHAGLVLVSGYSGIGKTSLISEIYKSIQTKKGNFVSGKFNQIEKNTPYYGLIKAFQDLLSQLLVENQVTLDIWKNNFIEALSPNAKVMIDILPELEQIIGPQDPVAELNPLEAQNRFQHVFREFIKVFAKKDHPLVVFIDDLQWSDIATLNFLNFLLSSSEVQYFLFIGAYRDNEVTTGHPLLSMIDQWITDDPNGSVNHHKILVKPLNKPVVNQLVADTLKCDPGQTETLTGLIYKKTNGNPFFINQVLNSLYKSGAVKFNGSSGKWDWDIHEARNIQISDNLIDLIVENLILLPEETLNILKAASCIGNRFDISLLSLIEDYSLSVIGKAIWSSIEKDIISPLDVNYRFISIIDVNNVTPLEMRFSFKHDRIYQAVYSLLKDTEKIKIHKKIGYVLLEKFRESKHSEMIFDVVNHLNMAKQEIIDFKQREELSKLNFDAGLHAKNSTAFAIAMEYFEISELMLSEKEWQEKAENLFKLLIEFANASLLSGDLKKSEALCNRLLVLAKTNLDKCVVANIRVLIYEFQGKMAEAIDEIRKALVMLKVELPETPQDIGQKLQEGIGKMQQGLAQRAPDKLIDLSDMTDPEKIMAMQLLFQNIVPALITNTPLYLLTVLTMFELTMLYGVHPLSCKCFVDCGIIQLSALDDPITAYKLGLAAFELVKKYKAESMKPAVYFGFTFLSHWNVHYQESLDYYELAYRCGLETGDIQHAAYSLSHKIHELMCVGKNLNECQKETDKAIIFAKESHTAMPLLLAEIIQYIIEKFRIVLNEDILAEFEKKDKDFVAKIEQMRNVPFLLRFSQYNTFFYMVINRFDMANKWNSMAENMIKTGLSDFPTADHYLFQGLIMINKWDTMDIKEQQEVEGKLQGILSKFKKWAKNCPANFLHKYYFLSAEIAKIKNAPLENIIFLYKKAIGSIGDGDFLPIKALINEWQGKFWLSIDYEEIGNSFIRDAYFQYRQWGAVGKMGLMEKEYNHFFTFQEENQRKKSRSHTADGDSIDMISILKSTQAISSEIKLEKLLTTLIQAIIENAGAQQGCLLLKNDSDNELYIEASKSADPQHNIEVLKSLPYNESKYLCPEIIQYVARTLEFLVLDNASSEGKFKNNPYILKNKIKSILCFPVIYQNKLKGIVYLENNLSVNVFTEDRVEVLKILSSQASISIDNARLYENLEDKVKERTIQLKSANVQLKELALHDPLTNLHNRRFTYEFVSDVVDSFVRNKERVRHNKNIRDQSYESNVLGIFLMDIDHFKEVNDTYGHKAGDLVLVELSKVIKSLIRTDDYVVRWGGEEFLIVLNNTKPEYLDVFAKKLISKISKTALNLTQEHTIYKTCSVGYTQMPWQQHSPQLLSLEQTINLSDYALYMAKENGRNCAAFLSVKKQSSVDENFVKHLIGLSKGTILNNKYAEIKFL